VEILVLLVQVEVLEVVDQKEEVLLAQEGEER
jgi:hypothetical protein